jgi:hypothetical protein
MMRNGLLTGAYNYDVQWFVRHLQPGKKSDNMRSMRIRCHNPGAMKHKVDTHKKQWSKGLRSRRDAAGAHIGAVMLMVSRSQGPAGF